MDQGVEVKPGDKVTVSFTFTIADDSGECICTNSSNLIDDDFARRLIHMSKEAWLEPNPRRVRIK